MSYALFFSAFLIVSLSEYSSSVPVESPRPRETIFNLNLSCRGIKISQPIDSIENLELVSNLNDTEKTILDMYKNNQFVYQDSELSRVWHGSDNS
ncbi:MAG: hypothetical protein NTV03_03135 [Candidatus Nomurabacteria bacterium]|nr:hypothetical protein [Candidatus Nomurabacteria bacterium]